MDTIGTMTCRHTMQWLEDRDGMWNWCCLSCGMAVAVSPHEACPAGPPAARDARHARHGDAGLRLVCLALAVCVLMLPVAPAHSQVRQGALPGPPALSVRDMTDELIGHAALGSLAGIESLLATGVNVNKKAGAKE